MGKSRNAFCVVRPPGHHAGINGLLEGGESCGFCIFNNVAAGAMHAVAEYKDICQRVAIVDIDVHHGNGTEEIVRKCNDPSTLFFFSIHLYDNDKDDTKLHKKKNHYSYKFYPGTGSNDDLAMNIMNVPVMPLWKDPTNTCITSAAPKTHNTRKKTRSNTTAQL
jgi:acetoin utilization deacetylase AcuC-like enzyme